MLRLVWAATESCQNWQQLLNQLLSKSRYCWYIGDCESCQNLQKVATLANYQLCSIKPNSIKIRAGCNGNCSLLDVLSEYIKYFVNTL